MPESSLVHWEIGFFSLEEVEVEAFPTWFDICEVLARADWKRNVDVNQASLILVGDVVWANPVVLDFRVCYVADCQLLIISSICVDCWFFPAIVEWVDWPVEFKVIITGIKYYT